jgi:hypothetical protein
VPPSAAALARRPCPAAPAALPRLLNAAPLVAVAVLARRLAGLMQ